MKLKKKNVITTGLAVSLAAVMLIGGGTFAYFNDSTEAVNNEFNTGKVTVDLYETDADGDKVSSRDDYNIIPGTSESKDPTVTVNATVDAYVFVVVTDNTEGLVTYTIDNEWTQLDGYDDVYYREVTGSTDKQSFTVLKDNKVSYDYTLENDDMIDDEGNLKEGIELSFKAYAIQKEPFTNAKTAFEASAFGVAPAAASDSESVLAAIKNGGRVLLTDDVTITAKELMGAISEGGYANIDLNGKTLTSDANVVLEDNQIVALYNGNVDFTTTDKTASSFDLNGSSILYLDNVRMDMNKGTIVIDEGAEASLAAFDSVLISDDSYVIQTNAGDSTSGEGVLIRINNTTVGVDKENEKTSNVGILFNVPGKLIIENGSKVVGVTQGVIARCGNVVIEDSTIETTIDSTSSAVSAYADGTLANAETEWGDGNKTAVAALVLGNYQPSKATGTNYPYPTTATITNSTFVSNSGVPEIVVAACRGYNATVTVDSDSQDFNVQKDDDSTITVNDNTYATGIYTTGAVG